MKCWECGNEGVKQFDLKQADWLGDKKLGYWHVSQRWYCEECFDRISQERKMDRTEYIRLKKKLMHERAVRMLERQELDLYEYKEALDAVREVSIENPNWFDSAHEMVAATIITSNELMVKHHHVIDGCEVDFFIPELKAVLEVDGELHKYSVNKDYKRDIKIRQALGSEYEVVRVGTKYLEENAELLVEAIRTMRAEKQRLRKEHGGVLPDWFTRKRK